MTKKQKKYKKETVAFNDVDVYIGKRLREFRMLAGLRQEDVAEAIGVRFQQLQKYETGANRIALSRAVKICEYLGITVKQLLGEYEKGGKKPPEFMRLMESDDGALLARLFSNMSKGERKMVLDEAKGLTNLRIQGRPNRVN